MEQKYICENKIRVRLLLLESTVEHCSCVNTREQSDFVQIVPSEAVELHQPVVLLCGSQTEMGQSFTSNLPLSAFCSH